MLTVNDKDINYICADGKIVRQIIIGHGQSKDELQVDDCKYIYIGADRTKEKWEPFFFGRNTSNVSGILGLNAYKHSSIPNIAQIITEKGVYGYAFALTAISMPTSLKSIAQLISNDKSSNSNINIVWNPTGPKVQININDYNGKQCLNEAIDISSIGSSMHAIINLYATRESLYSKSVISPMLYIDVIIYGYYDSEKRIQRHYCVEFEKIRGTCFSLRPFFSDGRASGVTCTCVSGIISGDYRAVAANVFAHYDEQQ